MLTLWIMDAGLAPGFHLRIYSYIRKRLVIRMITYEVYIRAKTRYVAVVR